MMRSNLLYAIVIESNGRIGKQLTFLGAVLVTIAAGAFMLLAYELPIQAIGWAAAALK